MLTQEQIVWIKTLMAQDKMVKFYQWKPWRLLRLEALERDNYECQECKRKGKFSKGRNVHHLIEVKERPDLALTLDNLETVCIQCHNTIHDKRLKNDKRKPFTNEERW